MITTVTTGTSAVSASLRNYFNRRLLEYAVPNRRYAQDALRAPLPERMGTNSNITWFRWPSPASADVLTLTEGTAPTGRKGLALTTVTAALTQYGQVTSVSDLLNVQQLFDTLEQGVRGMGEDLALHLDTTTRNAVVSAGPASANTVWGNGATAVGTAVGDLQVTDLLTAATRLRIDNAPQFGGYYHAIITPEQADDVMGVTAAGGWIDIHKYVDHTPILDGEIGRTFGIRVMVSTIPAFRAATAAPYTALTAAASSTDLYHGIVYGRDSYGIADIGSQSPYGPSMHIVNTADSNNPLNQYTSVGWKAFYAARILNVNFVAPVVTTTSYA